MPVATGPLARKILTVAALAPLLQGCCSLCSLWCGPDRSDWVQQDFRTPQAAVATFLEAARRDNVTVIYDTFGEDFKKPGNNPTGHAIDGVIAAVVWERLKESVAGLHLIGDAKTVAEEDLTFGRRRFVLEVAGRQFAVTVKRYPFYSIRCQVGGRDAPAAAGYVPALEPFVDLERGELHDTVLVKIPSVTLPEGIQRSDITGVQLDREWKLDGIEGLTEG